MFEKLLNAPCYKTEEVESENVTTAFFRTGDSKIELVESKETNGVIARFIEKKGEGLHHIAFEVADIENEMERLKKEGFIVLNEKPHKGADNKMVCFLHPKQTNGVLIELCMEITYSLIHLIYFFLDFVIDQFHVIFFSEILLSILKCIISLFLLLL